jgi:hypothetical protein
LMCLCATPALLLNSVEDLCEGTYRCPPRRGERTSKKHVERGTFAVLPPSVCEWFKARITHQHLVGDDVFEYEVHFDGWSTMWDESKCWKTD